MSESLIQKFKKLKEVFDNTIPPAAPAATPEPKQFSEYALQDGTPVTIDKLEAGGSVQVNGQPAPAGEHVLADGTKIKCAEGGIIESVEAPAADPNAAPEQDMNSKFSALETDYNSHKQDFSQYQQASEQRFAGYEKQVQDFSTALTQSNENMKQLMGIVEEMMKTEAAPAAEVKTSFSKVDDKKTNIDKYVQALKN
jgi:hypothetical protein